MLAYRLMQPLHPHVTVESVKKHCKHQGGAEGPRTITVAIQLCPHCPRTALSGLIQPLHPPSEWYLQAPGKALKAAGLIQPLHPPKGNGYTTTETQTQTICFGRKGI